MTKGTQICGTNRTGYIVIPAHAHFFLSVTILMAAMSLIQLGMAQEVKVTAPSFKYQHKNGTLDLDLSCSIHGLYDAFYSPKVESCFFEIRPPTGKAISASKRISSGQPETCAAVLSVQEPAMDPQGQFGMDPIGQVWPVSNDKGPMHFSIPHAWIKEGYEIRCLWNYYGCTLRNGGCESWSQESILESGMVDAALRIARIHLPTPSQGLVNGPVSIEIGKPLILYCSIQNLAKFGDHACEWTFSASDSRANISTIDRETFSKPLVSAKFGRDKLQLFSSSWNEYCRLNIAQTQFAHEGNWTCAPGNGTDGWINPSSPVEVKIAVNACTDNNDCNNGGGRNPELVCQVPSSLREAATHTKLCIHVCDTVQGSQVCGNLTNAHCQYNATFSDRVRCSCHPGFVSDTGFFQNRTRCVKKCTYDTDCLGNEKCVTGQTTNRCFPICKLYPCGANAHCLPSSLTRNRTCSCEDGTYPNDTSLGAESGCRAARFPGLRMLLLEDNGSTSRQECEGKEENGTKSCTFNVSEQANVSFICDASQTFPEPYLNVTTKHGNSSVPLEYAGDGTNITATLWNVSKADHNRAIITCDLSSEAHMAQIHVTLTVGALSSDATNSSSNSRATGEIAGIAMGVVVVLVLLALAALFAFKKLSNRQIQSGHENNLNVVNDASSLKQNEISRRGVTATPNAPSNYAHRPVRGQPQDDNVYRNIAGPPTPVVAAAALPNVDPSNREVGNKRQRVEAPTPGVKAYQPPALPPKQRGQLVQWEAATEKSHDDLIYATLDLITPAPSGAQSSTLSPAPGPNKGAQLDPKRNQGKFQPRRADEEESIYSTIVGEMTVIPKKNN